MKKLLAFLLLFVVCVSSGCGQLSPMDSKPKAFYTMTDVVGNQVVLEKKPEKIILLAPSFLNIMHAVGGDFTAWANSPSDKPPAFAKDKKTVGYTYQVNVEAIVSEKPDLVIGLKGLHSRLADTMQQNGIPFMQLSVSSYQEVMQVAEIFGDVTGNHEKGVEAAKKLESDMNAIITEFPDKQYTCAILHGTPHSVTLEGQGTIATETASLLHIRNVFVMGKDTDMKLPPFSLESLVSKEPDIIFLTTMVMPGQQEEAFRKALMDQPAWGQMKAVKAGRVYFLPQKLFLSSPGMEYPEALKYMAHVVYGNE